MRPLPLLLAQVDAMKLRVVWWIPVAAAILVQSSGIMTTAGNTLVGIDGAIRAIIDLKSIVAKIVPPPKFVPIKPVVIPKKMPAKVVKK